MRFVLAGARAELLERVRRPAFLIVLLVNAIVCFSIAAGDVTIRWGRFRGTSTGAWIGTNTALLALLVLSLAGFYLVKDALQRDADTGVAALLGASPVSSIAYLWSKAAGHLAYLLLLALPPLLLATAIARESVLAPFAFLLVPVLAFVAAMALLFETLPLLRGAFGNVAYFFLWCFLVAGSNQRHAAIVDLLGLGLIKPLIRDAISTQHAGAGGFFDVTLDARGLDTFVFPGIAWTRDVITARLLWALPFLVVPFLGALFFRPAKPRQPMRWLRAVGGLTERLTLSRWMPRSPFAGLTLGEVANAIKSQSGWWLLGAMWIAAASCVAPWETATRALYPLAAIWPLAALSGLGSRERKHGTAAIVYASPSPVTRHLGASAIAGAASMAVMLAGFLARAAMRGDWTLVAGGATAILFAPALALMLGTATRGSRAFEIAYTMLWYFGPVRGSEALDFLAPAPTFLLAAPLLFAIALLARREQLARGWL